MFRVLANRLSVSPMFKHCVSKGEAITLSSTRTCSFPPGPWFLVQGSGGSTDCLFALIPQLPCSEPFLSIFLHNLEFDTYPQTSREVIQLLTVIGSVQERAYGDNLDSIWPFFASQLLLDIAIETGDASMPG